MSTENIKEWCSCVRNIDKVLSLQDKILWLDENITPREGDLVLVEVVLNGNSYNHLENIHGRDVRLYPGDHIVCVLGTRKSGTKLSGSFPRTPIRKNMELELLSLGGIVGNSVHIPSYFGGKALIVRVKSFPFFGQSPLNIKLINTPDEDGFYFTGEAYEKTIWVGGTSAEAGKTTLVSKGILCLKDKATVGAIKIVGTGRLNDMLSYKDAGAAYISDYVDEGWPSTYNINSEDFCLVIERLLRRSNTHSDITFMEIGGDLLAGCAPEALGFASKSSYPFFFVVNDAMGALSGLEILKSAGINNICICTLKQNSESLSERLGQYVLDVSDTEKVHNKFNQIQYVTVS
ncbi:MAG: hypothetical protein ACJ75B_07095 [Flavisolibacter sp.]